MKRRNLEILSNEERRDKCPIVEKCEHSNYYCYSGERDYMSCMYYERVNKIKVIKVVKF